MIKLSRPTLGGVRAASGLLIAAGLLLLGADRPHLGAARGSEHTGVVAIDLLLIDGHPDTLRLVPGVRYRIDQIDLSATDRRPEDDGLQALMTQSVFAPLDWRGLTLAFSDTARGLDGRPFLRQIYRDARWMTGAHRFRLTPRDAGGDPLAPAIVLESDPDRRAIPSDDFLIRRPVVIRDHRDGLYQSEALLQLRNGGSTPLEPEDTFVMTALTSALELSWEIPGPFPQGEPVTVIRTSIPIIAVSDPPFAYGFQCELELVNPPPGAIYAPGETVEVSITFRDGEGNRLHPPGSLPTYNQFRHGLVSGLRYYDFYPSVLFFKDKNKEGVMLFAFAGPVERVRQVYFEIPTGDFANTQQMVAFTRRDGYACIWQGVPPSNVLLGGLANSTLWDTPISDRLRFRIPTDVIEGRYRVIGKARRMYLGESSLITAEVFLDVRAHGGQMVGNDGVAGIVKQSGPFAVCPLPRPSLAPPPADGPDYGSELGPAGLEHRSISEPWVGKCKDCHDHGFELGGLLHSNGDPGSCAVCHAPLSFEPDNMLVYRVHFLHFFSRRYQGGAKTCAACHYSGESVERVSRLACLSCHVTYHGGADQYGNYRSCSFSKCHDGAHNRF